MCQKKLLGIRKVRWHFLLKLGNDPRIGHRHEVVARFKFFTGNVHTSSSIPKWTPRCNANDRRVSRNLFVRRVSRVSREVSKDYPYCVNSIREWINMEREEQRLRQGDISPDRDNSSPLFAQSLYVMYYDCIVVYCDYQNASVEATTR